MDCRLLVCAGDRNGVWMLCLAAMSWCDGNVKDRTEPRRYMVLLKHSSWAVTCLGPTEYVAGGHSLMPPCFFLAKYIKSLHTLIRFLHYSLSRQLGDPPVQRRKRYVERSIVCVRYLDRYSKFLISNVSPCLVTRLQNGSGIQAELQLGDVLRCGPLKGW